MITSPDEFREPFKMRFAAIRRVSKNTGMLLAGTVVRMVFSFAFIIYAARYLGVEGFGKFTLAQHYFELFLSLCATGLGILITRETAKDAAWLRGNLAPALVLVTMLSVAAGAMLAGVARLIGYAPDTRMAIYIATAALLPGAVCTLAEAVFVAFEKAEFVAVGTAAESLVRTVLGFAVLMLGYGLLSLLVVLVVTRLMLLVLYGGLLLRRLPAGHWSWGHRAMRTLALQCRVFAAEVWLSTLYLNLDVVLLSVFHGETAVGIYQAAWKLIRLGTVVAQSFATAVFPYISRLYVSSRDVFQQVNEQSLKYILASILPAVVGITILADRIVLFVYDTDYTASVPVLRVLAWLLVPQFLNPFLSRVLYARGEQRRSLMVAAVGLASFTILAICLIPRWAALGTAWASLLSALVALACYLAFCFYKSGGARLVVMLARQGVATGMLCTLLYVMRAGELLPTLAAGAALYLVLLYALRVVSTGDVKLLQELR
jgi:O-antigen/teichoic acid export membrane protein